MKIADVARIAYEAVRAYAAGIGDNHHRKWRRLDEAHQQSLIDGVLFHYLNPRLGPEAAHLHRCKKLMEKGWSWGPVKAEEDRQSPILVPWEELPEARQMKYFIFGCIAANLAQFVEDGPVPPQEQRQVGVGGAVLQEGEAPAPVQVTDPLSAIVGAPLSGSENSSSEEQSESPISNSQESNGQSETQPSPSDMPSKDGDGGTVFEDDGEATRLDQEREDQPTAA
jgi:hypothetical protein